jgi:hypothetical protein
MASKYETVIIPKGTLLFRSTNSTHDIVKDFAGIPKTNGEFCLYPNFNVFFYPFPFASESVKKYTFTNIYILNNDVKLLNLILPSKYSRHNRYEEKGGIISCNKIKDTKGCTTFGKSYDPCIDFEQVKDDSVVGMIALARLDVLSLKKLLGSEEPNNNNNNNNNYGERRMRHREEYYNEYYRLYKDNRGMIGVPEIVLYPRKKIVHEGITEKISDYTEFMESHIDNFNYSLFHTVRTLDEKNENTSDLQIFMEDLKNNTFKKYGESFNIAVNKETGFYQMIQYTNGGVPLDADNHLSIIYPQFKFESGTIEELDDLTNIEFAKILNEWIEEGDVKKVLELNDLGLVNIPNLPKNVLNISLDGNKIEQIKNLPPNLISLSLDNNKIQQIKNLPPTLVKLSLNKNKIKTIMNLPENLKLLSIESNTINRIHTLPRGLEVLKISGNRGITSLTNLPNSLTDLIANDCGISDIDKFGEKLTTIELQNNILETIPRLPNTLKILELEGNTLIELPHIPSSVTVLNYDEIENVNPNYI